MWKFLLKVVKWMLILFALIVLYVGFFVDSGEQSIGDSNLEVESNNDLTTGHYHGDREHDHPFPSEGIKHQHNNSTVGTIAKGEEVKIKKTEPSSKLLPSIPFNGEKLQKVIMRIDQDVWIAKMMTCEATSAGVENVCVQDKTSIFIAKELQRMGYSLDATIVKMLIDKEYNAFIQTSELVRVLIHVFPLVVRKSLSPEIKSSGYFPSYPYPQPVW